MKIDWGIVIGWVLLLVILAVLFVGILVVVNSIAQFVGRR